MFVNIWYHLDYTILNFSDNDNNLVVYHLDRPKNRWKYRQTMGN